MAITNPFLPKALSEDNTKLSDRLREIASTFDTFDGRLSSQDAPSLKEESILPAPTLPHKLIAPPSSESNNDNLFAAAESGNVSQVRQLLKKGADPNVKWL